MTQELPNPERGAPDEFYVGYLPAVPRGIASRVKAALAAIFVAGAAITGIGAALQRDPGRAEWAERSTIAGVFGALPYPHIIRDDQQGTVLLVCEGKHAPGVESWCGPAPTGLGTASTPVDGRIDVRALDGLHVEVSGQLIRRLDGRGGNLQVFELGAGAGDFKASSPPLVPRAPASAPEQVTLIGEIVDPKCFLGVMKPGEGRTHRACAWLCVRGGIAPVLKVDGEPGRGVVIATAEGGPANLQVLDLAGDRVELLGELIRQDGLEILRLGPDEIRRVP